MVPVPFTNYCALLYLFFLSPFFFDVSAFGVFWVSRAMRWVLPSQHRLTFLPSDDSESPPEESQCLLSRASIYSPFFLSGASSLVYITGFIAQCPLNSLLRFIPSFTTNPPGPFGFVTFPPSLSGYFCSNLPCFLPKWARARFSFPHSQKWRRLLATFPPPFSGASSFIHRLSTACPPNGITQS